MGQLLENTLLGGVMILVAAALRRILRGRLSPNVALLLWAVCLARLLTPVPLTGTLSPYGPVIREAETAAWAERYEAPGPAVPGTAADATEPGAWGEENPAPARSFADALPAVWAALAALLAALAVWAWLRSRRRVRAVPLAGERLEGVLPARARLRIGRVPGAPLTFGVVRPDVVVTPGLQGKEYTYVLAHEAAHVRRGDNLWHYAAALAVCVHWFNPAVWLMAALIRRDVELACDRAVLRRLGPDRRAEYANALITLSTKAEGSAFCHGFGLKRTEERIVVIMKFKKTTFCGLLAALVLILGATTVFATSPEGEEDAFSPATSEAEGALDSEEQTNNIFSPDGLYAILPDGQVIDALTGEIIPNLRADIDDSNLPIDEKMDNFVKWYNENYSDSLPPAAPKTDAFVIMPDGQMVY